MNFDIKEKLQLPKKPKLALAVIILALAVSAVVYLLVINTKVCKDEACFTSKLVQCDRAIYTADNRDTITYYEIKGQSGESCEIRAEILQLKQGSAELSQILGKDMTCLLPLGVNAKPEEKLEYCHGLLKEEIQEILLQRLHEKLAGSLTSTEESRVI